LFSGIRKDENGIPLSEENFEEAIRAVNSVVLPSKIPHHIREILDDSRCVNLTAKVIIFTFYHA